MKSSPEFQVIFPVKALLSRIEHGSRDLHMRGRWRQPLKNPRENGCRRRSAFAAVALCC
jgi:hypothetical protein